MKTLPDVEDEVTHAQRDPDVFHYVDKCSILASAMDGGIVVALCGERFQVKRVPKPDSPICKSCKDLLELLKGME